jgi:putative phage-type endonuclease
MNLMAALIAERLTGVPADSYTNAAMQWGTEKEPEARAVYEFMHGVTVEQIGFVDHPTIDMAGCSPDGLVGVDGLVEIKCPNTATHIDTLLGQKIPQKYEYQMQFQMACTGRKWCDFVSFDPRMPGDMQFFVKRLSRLEDDRMADFEKQIRDFLTELEAKLAALVSRYREAA